MQNGLFTIFRALRGRKPPAPVVVHPTQIIDERPDIEDFVPGCSTGIYALGSDELAFGTTAAPPDMMGIRSRYDRASDHMLTVIGVPGRLPIGLLLLLLDLTLRSRDGTLSRLLTGRGTNGAKYFGDGQERMHPLLAEAQAIAEVISWQLDREADVDNVRAYSCLYCDTADSLLDFRFGGCMAVCDATAELLASPLRHSAKEASAAYLHHLVDHLAKRLQSIPGLLADGMVIAPTFRAIAIVEADASAF